MSQGWQVQDLIPHSGEIVLLEQILEVGEDFLQATTQPRRDGLFNVTDTQVPAFMAVEYMAQAVAAWAGHRGRRQGGDIQPGLLLGVRDFNASAAYLQVGEPLQVQVTRVMEMPSGLGVFDGKVTGESALVTARLSVLTVQSLEDLPQ